MRIDGVDLSLSNLDKALYRDAFTKGEWSKYIVIDDLRTLVWCANLAALELPQWKVGSRGGVHDPDLMVFDLRPRRAGRDRGGQEGGRLAGDVPEDER